jgi:glutathione S-transferase
MTNTNTTLPKLELISFKLCPFVQKVVIALKFQKINYDITYINLKNPPAWFKEISPLAKVPILKVADEVLFESSVIQEFIDDISNNSMHPEDFLEKAKSRALASFGSSIFEMLRGVAGAKNKEECMENVQKVVKKLSFLEENCTDNNYFFGNKFKFLDASLAPLFMRMEIINQSYGLDFLDSLPKLKKYSKNVLEVKCVTNSVVEEFLDLYTGMISSLDGYLFTLLKK